MPLLLLAIVAVLWLAAPAGAAVPATWTSAPGKVTVGFEPRKSVLFGFAALAPQPDGTTYGAMPFGREVRVVRLLADGRRDRGYGDGGVATLPGRFVSGLYAQPGGGAIVVTQPPRGAPPQPPRVVRLTPEGRVDTGFGGGFVDLDGITAEGPAALTPDGGVVVAGRLDQRGTDLRDAALMRVLPSGAIDRSFGTGGLRKLPEITGVIALAVQADGGIVASTTMPSGDELQGPAAVVRLDRTGAYDPAYGGTGIVGVPGRAIDDLALDTAGRPLGLGSDAEGRLLMRLLPSGTPDPAFGAGGTVALPPAAAWLAPLPDGGAAAAGADADGRAWIERVSDTGAPAGSFRTPMELGGGWFHAIDTLAPLGGDLLSMDAAARPDGSLLLGGWVEVAGPEGPEGDGAPQAGQPLVAAFGADGALLPGFGRPTALGLGVRAAAQRYSRRGLAVRFRPRARGLARVRVTLDGQTVAQRMVPFRSQRALRIRIPWTRSGRARVAARPATLTVAVAANDLAGNEGERRIRVRVG